MSSRPPCLFDGCGEPNHAKGYCPKHYERYRRYGDPSIIRMKVTDSGEIREFLIDAINSSVDHCIIWPYALAGKYGVYRSLEPKSDYAHVYVCIRAHGDRREPGIQVRHLCGEALCVNPRHLRWGTQSENQQDRILHGTYQYGDKNPGAKLRAKDVVAIREMAASGTPLKSIAAIYGITPSNVSVIVSRKSWRHIP